VPLHRPLTRVVGLVEQGEIAKLWASATGAAVDTANWGQMAKVDENAGELNEALADLFTAVLVDNGLIEPLVTGERS
jgi:hypothetical protein